MAKALDDMTEPELQKLVHEIGARLDSDQGKPGDRAAKLAAFQALERKILDRQAREWLEKTPEQLKNRIAITAGIASESTAGTPGG